MDGLDAPRLTGTMGTVTATLPDQPATMKRLLGTRRQ